MPFTDKIVELINVSLKGSSLNKEVFQPGQFHGISSVIGITKDAGLSLVPGILDGSGSYKAVSPDQKYNLVIYHKCIANDYDLDRKNSYGDSFDFTCRSQMQMVVWGDGKKMKLTADTLEAIIVFGIPQNLSSMDRQNLGLKSCRIMPMNSNMDRLNCFRQEYVNYNFNLKADDCFFIIRYKIETTFGQNCIDMCCQ